MRRKSEWTEAILPGPYYVGGLPLLPMTIGHVAVLHLFDNAYALPQPEAPEFADAVTACWVCSRPWQESAFRSRGWRYRLWMAWRLRRWMDRIPEVEAGFLVYHANQWVTPAISYERQGKRRGAELVHALYLHRRRIMGEDRETALGVAIREAQWDFLADAESEGAVRLIDQDLDLMEGLAAKHADWDREVRSNQAKGNGDGAN